MHSKQVQLSEARRILGVSHNTMLRILAREGIPTVSDPLDLRRKYVKREDIERLKRATEALREEIPSQDARSILEEKAA